MKCLDRAELKSCVETALKRIGDDDGSSLGNACRTLLCEDNEAEWLPDDVPDLLGYPWQRFRRFATNVISWIRTGECEFLKQDEFPLLDEVPEKSARIGAMNKIFFSQSVVEKLIKLIKDLDIRGILDILGFRQTLGSVSTMLPSREKLLSAFQNMHSEKATLSVGARALAKHCHRDQTSAWWGVSKGKEAAKNEHALRVVSKILDNAAWMNMHVVPAHDTAVLEIRVKEGYGARWTADGGVFRGFLEPQMKDGHSVNWRH
ncbi:uncharacterized protein [Oscarella lobularis]|uniref:uncharacterized protein n=1 Tax=Oscarella lobularis TaxID=121494 RepID=UPI0033134AF4